MKEEFLRLLEEEHFSPSSQAVLSQLPVNTELAELICSSDADALLDLMDEIIDDPDGNIKGVVHAILQARSEGTFCHSIFHRLLLSLTEEDKVNEDRSLQIIQILISKVSKKEENEKQSRQFTNLNVASTTE